MNSRTIRSGGINLQGLAARLNRELDEYLARPVDPFTGPKRLGARRAPVVASRATHGLSATPAKQPALKTEALDRLIQDAQALQGMSLSDDQIRRIPSEDQAALAHQLSKPLRREFPSERGFVAYWQAQRRKSGLTVAASTEARRTSSAERTEQDPTFLKEWQASAALRAEFREDFPSYRAYKLAAQRGAARIVGERKS